MLHCTATVKKITIITEQGTVRTRSVAAWELRGQQPNPESKESVEREWGRQGLRRMNLGVAGCV